VISSTALFASLLLFVVRCVEHAVRGRDRLVTLRAPQRFHAVSQFYEHFDEVTESRVMALLATAKPAVELTV